MHVFKTNFFQSLKITILFLAAFRELFKKQVFLKYDQLIGINLKYIIKHT